VWFVDRAAVGIENLDWGSLDNNNGTRVVPFEFDAGQEKYP